MQILRNLRPNKRENTTRPRNVTPQMFSYLYVQLPVGAPAPTFSKVNGSEHRRRTAARPLSLLAREESSPGFPGLILDSLVSRLFLLSHLLRYQEGPDVQHDVLHVQLGSQSIL